MVNCIGGEQLAMEVEEWMEVSVSWWWAKAPAGLALHVLVKKSKN
jgi:hypothetical protein